MAKSNVRKALAARNGERFSVVATVERFGSRRGWQGRDEPTVLLVDLFDAAQATRVCDHLWFKKGRWAAGLTVGDRIRFDARVGTYEKGYRGHREDAWDAPPPSTDWRLGRPTKVVRLTEPQATEIEADSSTGVLKEPR